MSSQFTSKFWANEFTNSNVSVKLEKQPQHITNVIKEYARYCTLHGIQYVVKENSTFIERAVWFAIILTSFICASLLVNTMWTRFRMSPTMTAVKDTHLPLYSLPFPAVSVCSTDKIKREEAYVYLSKYVNMTNDKVRKGVDYFLNAMALFQHPMYSRMIPFLEKSGKVLKALAAVNLTDFMLQVTPTCDEIFNRCFWIGKSYNCCTLFRQQRTEEGFCYSFNSLTSRHDEYCQAVGNLGSFSEFRHPSDAKACPLRRNTAAGSSSGLEVFLKSFNVSNRITNANDTIGIHGYRVQIFYVAEYPEAGMGSLVESEIGIKLVVTVKPSVTISTEAIRHLDINDRFCYFPDEQSLSISYSYSQKSCLIECRLNHLKKVCRCRPYYFNMLECCKFHDHWVGNWYQSGIRKTISIQGNRFSSKGSCIASDGDKFLIADDERICYRCVVIHEKHYNVLQYKETFCHGRETLNKICALITGEALLYSMFRENATPITCPFKPPYTFTYNRGHGECRYPVSTIDSCTQDSKFVIQYQACPDVYGSESALEEIQCLAVWKEGSYRYLVGKVNNYHIGSGEDHYRCFVFEKSSTFPSISMDSDSTVDREVEYKIAQSGDATCTGLFSPAEGSRTMILKRTPHNFKCKFPNWMTKKKQWHTLDYSYSYTFWQNNNTLSIANTTSLMDENYYLNEKLTRHSLFNGDEIRINCVDAIKSSNDYVQLLTHYLTECQRGYLCITLHKRSDHIAEIQLGAATKRQEDACQRNFFDPSKTAYITLVTPEPETKVCPFFGNFRVNGVSGVEQSVSDRFSSDESRNSQPYLSSVDIMETFSDNLSQNYLRADSQVTHDDAADSQPYSRNSKYTRRRNVKRRDINYVGFQSNAKLNLSTTYVLSPSGSASLAAAPVSTPRGHERARSRSSRRPEAAENGTARVKRSASSGDKKNSCILNFNKLYFGCRSPDTMEFRSDCPLFSSDIISVYLCHGSWIHNVSQNSSVHYLVTTPLSRTSRGVRRYCFMYQTNEDSSLIHFTSTSDTCHRDSVPGADGALSFNITPIGGAGKCAELNSTSVQSSLSWLAAATIVLHCVFTISSRFSLIR